LEGLGINLGYLLVQLISFLVMVVILRAWAYKPILNMLEQRRKNIAQGLEDARVASEARQNAERDAEQILNKAQQDAAERVRDATRRAEQVGKDLQASAEQDAAAIREGARHEAEQIKAEALGELRGQVASLAIAAAQKIIGEALNEQRQRALIEEFFSGIKAGKVTLLEETQLTGAKAIVTSAVPLTADEQNTVRQDIIQKMGSGASISFRVDPSILGGLIVRVGDKILDGSVSGKLQSLDQNLR